MKLNNKTISDTSSNYYVSTLPAVRQLLYYPVSVGYFECRADYYVSRQNYNSFLLLVMFSGRLSYQNLSRSGEAAPGNVLLLDCYAPHSYGALTPCSFMFLHFDGAQSRALCEAIFTKVGNLISMPNTEFLTDWLGELMRQLSEEKRLKEFEISAHIYDTLMRLFVAAGNASRNVSGLKTVDDAIGYVLNNLGENLTVESIANAVGYSPSYFSRVFREETGMSPYQFLVKCRVDRARHLLHTTRDSIQDIAYGTGFGSAANFCYAFRRETGMSPSDCRKQPL